MKINSQQLKKLFLYGATNLENNYREIDALNVFPIPDGDTGTNMMMTLQNGIKNIENMEDVSCHELAASFAKGLLLGARGNSGVILSQIFRGFAEGIDEGVEEIDSLCLEKALSSGKSRAYKAVLKPVEGTILTIISDVAKAMSSLIKEDDEHKIFRSLVEKAKQSLANTPNLLPVLKEAHVVDSGGAGLVKIIEGFYMAISGEKLTKVENKDVKKVVDFALDDDNDEEDFGYCTEFILRLLPNEANKIKFNQNDFRAYLESIGASIVLVCDDDIVKVHVHTYTPGDVLNHAQKYGEFVTLKIENMDEQHSNLTQKVERKAQAIVTVAVGEGLTDLFKQLGVDIVISGGQTMNPSTEDFVKAISKLNPESCIILPNNSNITMSAKQAANILKEKGIIVKIVPTTSIQQGITACMGYNPNIGIDDNVIEMLSASKHVTCGQITTAVRDSFFNGINIKAGEYLGIKEKSIVVSNKSISKTAIALLDSMMSYDAEIVTIITGKNYSKKALSSLKEYIAEKYKHVEVEVKQGDQPVYYFLLAVE